MKKIIIVGFYGIGKTHFFNNYKDYLTIRDYSVYDLEDYSFYWIQNEVFVTLNRNPNYPNNYISFLKKLIDKDEKTIIMIPSKLEIIENMISSGINDFMIVCPKINLKLDYITKYDELKNGAFTLWLYENWENILFNLEMFSKKNKIDFHILEKGKSLTDIIIKKVNENG